MFKILSIDGGGIRGIIPAMILAEIEKRTGKPIAGLFDLMAGTSTGGILALGMARPDEHKPGMPKFSAKQGIAFYEEEGKRVFSRSALYAAGALGNLAEEKYPSVGIESVLDEYFGEARLKEAATDVLIPAYDIERREAIFFKSRKARENPADDFLMKYVARATSAAPTYFEPHKLDVSDSSDYYALVDGGVHSNNPAMCAFAEAKAHYADAKDILLVSLGTGQATRPFMYNDAKGWGLAGWAKPLLDIMFDGMLNTVHYQLQQFLPDHNKSPRYYRFQARLDQGAELDNTDPIAIRNLKLSAEAVIRDNDAALDALCKQVAA